MIVLDTNVVSEPLKPLPDPVVMAWFARQAEIDLHLTSVNLAELLAGVAILPDGRRKAQMGSDLEDFVRRTFGTRILPFDARAARAYADINARALRMGVTIGLADGQIAAVALTQGFTVATRDTAPFLAAGLNVVNPWTSA